MEARLNGLGTIENTEALDSALKNNVGEGNYTLTETSTGWEITTVYKKYVLDADGNLTIGNDTPGGEEDPTEPLVKGKKVTGKNAEWKDETNEYPAIIPVGFCVVTDAGTIEEGLVISDVENDDMENTKKGNQFVWIPVNDYSKFHLIEGYDNGHLDSKLKKTSNPSREAGDTLDVVGSPMAKNNTKGTKESVAMYNSVKINHGFYIARFEAGIEGTTDNYHLSTDNQKVADGNTKPLSQKGVGVWNGIHWGGTASDIASDGMIGDDSADGAVKVARSMYTKNEECGVTSTLCYSVQWDAIMNFIDPDYVKETGLLEGYVVTGGAERGTKVGLTGNFSEKNIYDLGRNVSEWTMEAYDLDRRVHRGGSYVGANGTTPPSYRSTKAFALVKGFDYDGFRVALYL